MRTALLKLLVSSIALCAAAAVHASLLEGSFTGHARDSTWAEVPDGTPLSGSFTLDTATLSPGGSGKYFFPDTGFALTVDAPTTGFHHDLLLFFGELTLSSVDDRQFVEIATSFPRGETALLKLGGAAGTFFTDPTAESLHGGTPDLALSSLYLATYIFTGFDVELGSLAFDDAGAIPEPGSLSLIAMALGLGVAMRRLRPPNRL